METINTYLKEIQQQPDELSNSVQKSIILFAKLKPYGSFEELMQLLTKSGFTKMTSEDNIYRLLVDLVGGVGRHTHISDKDYNPNELQMGVEIEKEHTDNPNIAKEIAKDHLAECPDYYTRLKKIESECNHSI